MAYAREMGFNFSGRVHHGFATRYNSSKSEIYAILESLYSSLDEESQEKFHITTTGHSLGGAMATVGYADLSREFAQRIWGSSYRNADFNRVRAYAISAPRAFDEDAVMSNGLHAGMHNIILDTSSSDPVSMTGPGRTLTKWLENSYTYGPTRLLASLLNRLGVVQYSNPQAIAWVQGNCKHLGFKALQPIGVTLEKARTLECHSTSQKGLFGNLLAKVKGYFAPYHYGNALSYGVCFDTRLLCPSTLEARINAVHVPHNSTASASAKPWYQFW
jgi:hypothetical protein